MRTLQKFLNVVEEPILIAAVSFFSGISTIPLYLIGKSAIEQALPNTSGLSTINGLICASLTFPFNFDFMYREYKTIGMQWRIANRYGKLLLVGSSLLAFSAGGIANCYYMEGNLFFKIISLLVPAISARSIIADWILRTHLTLKKSAYKNTTIAYRTLITFSLNLKFNNMFKENFLSSGLSTKEAGNEIIRFSKKEILTFLHFSPTVSSLRSTILRNNLVISDLQDRYPRYGKCLVISKSIIVGVIGTVASFQMYNQLGPQAGACIFGSQLQHTFATPQVICPISSSIGENLGEAIGHITFGVLTATTVFPIIALIDVIRSSWTNQLSCSRFGIYLFSIVAALCRATIVGYMQRQNSGENTNYYWLVYVGVVFLLFNFFSSAILGPSTAKTIWRTLTNASKKICAPCASEETQNLTAPVDVTETLSHCYHLQSFCLFQPELAESLLPPLSETISQEYSHSRTGSFMPSLNLT